MHGLGDNLHMRAIIRQLLARNQYDLWLETSWVSLFHDFIAQGLKVVNKRTRLRTQTKNAQREANSFYRLSPPGGRTLTISYPGADVARHGSVLAAMMARHIIYHFDYRSADFRLPVPADWYEKVDALIARWNPSRPILVTRPLVLRPRDWGGCAVRNPEAAAYARLHRHLRERYFVVSVADLEPNVEWSICDAMTNDIELHKGELDFKSLAALFSRAALVYASPGFAIPLAQAVSTPVVCMFGGYEHSISFSAGARYSPYLGLDTLKPCCCMTGHCRQRCDKRIDIEASITKVDRFLDSLDRKAANQMAISLPPVHESGRDGNLAVAG